MLMIWMAAVLAVAVAWWWFRRGPARAAPSPVTTQRTAAPQGRATSVPTLPATVAPAPEPEPAELRAFEWLREQDMDPAQRETLVAAIKGIPRPPRSMQQLLSPEFVARAGSSELSELVMGEPLIAARVLSTVNAPFYGLQKPVTNIGQAVTFLGMNTLRSICLQYMLAEAFKPKLAEAQRSFDTIWRASAVASELCVRLGKALNLPDQGSLSTQVVLSFVGQLATASLLPASGLEHWLSRGRLERARMEQERLGLNASEIGCLLMKTWELPAGLVNDVSGLGQQLVTSCMTTDPVRAPRLALGYLCARLGERLALGQLGTLEGYDVKLDANVDTFHLRAALAHPSLARLDQALAAPELQTAVLQMMGRQAA
ncbi:HDOD domain-containing protein [Hydrogenophaga sp.]|uniref:HDOD domain-containing protein n=1 Tax=Hydrogenophaga sp. TaxID=1904254 RepID=UPI0025BE4EB2|nr:HDOD domain-containing protein [Hydrogenophaga sp.]